MKEFIVKQKVYIKSNNNIDKISLKYTYSLIAFTILTIILSVIFGYQTYAISVIKSVIFSLVLTTIITYLINIIKKDYQLKKLYKDNNMLSVALIIALFSTSCPYYVTATALLITIVVKNINHNRTLSSTLYGILIIILYKYFFTNYQLNQAIILPANFKVIDLIISPNHLSPVLSILSFIYIFYNKSIKYNIVISYILTILSIIFLYTILNSINIKSILYFASMNSLLFLSIYTLPDYKITPTIARSQIIYGIILGTITSILIFFISNLSIVIPLIIAPFIMTKPLEDISPKLKYNNKIYYLIVLLCIIIVIITIISLIAIKQ